MLFMLFRSALSLFAAAGLLSISFLGIKAQTQASTARIDPGINAPAFVIGPIYTQPIDPSGKLLLSSWLDPDGSDFDQYVWDNFTLPSNETITEIDWFGGYDPTRLGRGGPVVDFTVAIYPSNVAGTEPAVAMSPARIAAVTWVAET